MLQYLTSDKQSWVLFVKNWFPSTPDALASVNLDKPDYHHVIKMFGKDIRVPRYLQTYGADYHFSGAVAKSRPFTPELFDILEKLEVDLVKLVPDGTPSGFNMCLVNWYETGKHYIGPHSDEEKQFMDNAPIAGLSWGATRTFVLSPKKEGKALRLQVNDGDLVVMGGRTQKTHKHEVPKSSTKDERVSFTFRIFRGVAKPVRLEEIELTGDVYEDT